MQKTDLESHIQYHYSKTVILENVLKYILSTSVMWETGLESLLQYILSRSVHITVLEINPHSKTVIQITVLESLVN